MDKLQETAKSVLLGEEEEQQIDEMASYHKVKVTIKDILSKTANEIARVGSVDKRFYIEFDKLVSAYNKKIDKI